MKKMYLYASNELTAVAESRIISRNTSYSFPIQLVDDRVLASRI
jgi:hypothetical protein